MSRIVFGMIVGGMLALCYTPKTGEEMREILSTHYAQAKHIASRFMASE